jgi:hypothetical protein
MRRRSSARFMTEQHGKIQTAVDNRSRHVERHIVKKAGDKKE